MADAPVQLIVAAFEDEGTADEALTALKQAKRDRLIGIESAAVLRKDDKGKLHIKETADMGTAKGALLGGGIGAVIGIIAETALAVPLVIGGLIGGLAARLRDSGFNNNRLKRFGDDLPPGSSVIVALVEHRWVEDVSAALEESATDVITDALSDDIVTQLESHHDAAYTALKTDGAITAGRVAANDDEAEGAIFTANQQTVSGSSYVATDDGIVVAAAGADDNEVVEGVAAVANPGEGDEEKAT